MGAWRCTSIPAPCARRRRARLSVSSTTRLPWRSAIRRRRARRHPPLQARREQIAFQEHEGGGGPFQEGLQGGQGGVRGGGEAPPRAGLVVQALHRAPGGLEAALGIALRSGRSPRMTDGAKTVAMNQLSGAGRARGRHARVGALLANGQGGPALRNAHPAGGDQRRTWRAAAAAAAASTGGACSTGRARARSSMPGTSPPRRRCALGGREKGRARPHPGRARAWLSSGRAAAPPQRSRAPGRGRLGGQSGQHQLQGVRPEGGVARGEAPQHARRAWPGGARPAPAEGPGGVGPQHLPGCGQLYPQGAGDLRLQVGAPQGNDRRARLLPGNGDNDRGGAGPGVDHDAPPGRRAARRGRVRAGLSRPARSRSRACARRLQAPGLGGAGQPDLHLHVERLPARPHPRRLVQTGPEGGRCGGGLRHAHRAPRGAHAQRLPVQGHPAQGHLRRLQGFRNGQLGRALAGGAAQGRRAGALDGAVDLLAPQGLAGTRPAQRGQAPGDRRRGAPGDEQRLAGDHPRPILSAGQGPLRGGGVGPEVALSRGSRRRVWRRLHGAADDRRGRASRSRMRALIAPRPGSIRVR